MPSASSTPWPNLNRAPVTTNETTAEARIPRITPKKSPLAVTPMKAKKLPGAAGPVRPTSNAWKTAMPEAPPAIVARIILGA